jgi:hypothetical protein
MNSPTDLKIVWLFCQILHHNQFQFNISLVFILKLEFKIKLCVCPTMILISFIVQPVGLHLPSNDRTKEMRSYISAYLPPERSFWATEFVLSSLFCVCFNALYIFRRPHPATFDSYYSYPHRHILPCHRDSPPFLLHPGFRRFRWILLSNIDGLTRFVTTQGARMILVASALHSTEPVIVTYAGVS